MTAAGQRITALERQVAELSERLEEYRRKAATLRTFEEILFEGHPAFAGRASAREDTRPRAASRRPRHLHAVEARHA